jgi:hypothetical protein
VEAAPAAIVWFSVLSRQTDGALAALARQYGPMRVAPYTAPVASQVFCNAVAFETPNLEIDR